MATLDYNSQLDANITSLEYSPPPPGSLTEINNFGDTTTIVTSINGTTGNITIAGGSTGYAFTGVAGTVTLSVSNAATVRSSISAAKSGANDNINTFTALTGNTGWSAWTGGSDKTSHATYSGTASIGYVQAELQGVMDSLKQMTEAYKALQDVLLGIGITEA